MSKRIVKLYYGEKAVFQSVFMSSDHLGSETRGRVRGLQLLLALASAHILIGY